MKVEGGDQKLQGMNLCAELKIAYRDRLPIKDPCFLQYISQIDVGVKEVRIQLDGLFEVMNGEPNLTLSIEHAAKVRPCNSKIWLRFYCFQVACLSVENN